MALALGILSSAATAYDNYHQAITKRTYNLDIWNTSSYGEIAKDYFADKYAGQKFGAETIDDSSWITNDVKHAWIQGHSGKGTNVLVIDDFWHPSVGPNGERTTHGGLASTIVGGDPHDNLPLIGIAPGANVWTTGKFNKMGYFGGFKQNVLLVNGQSNQRHWGHGSTKPVNDGVRIARSYHNNVKPVRSVIVVPAGNGAGTCQIGGICNRFATQFLGNSETRDKTLIVGALDSNNNIVYNSNKAGTTKDNYVVDDGFLYTKGAGIGATSWSAPRVAGKAAIIKGKFSHLNATQISNIIKTTADDLGAPGVDNIYGHGKVNLKRALSPVGNLR